MALADEVEARVGTKRLLELTNPSARGATTIDAARIAAAVADAGAEFEVETGLALDESIPAHVAVAWVGVLYYLVSYSSGSDGDANKLKARWERGLRKIAHGLGADRIVDPEVSNNVVIPTTTNTRHPEDDRAAWRDVSLRTRGGDDSDRDYRRG